MARHLIELCLDSGGVHRPLPFLLALLAAGALIAGCGGSDKPNRPPPQPEPTGQPADFPSAGGKTLNDLASMADGQGPVLAPSVSLLHKGVNRYGFALFDTARKQITGAEVALYTAPLGRLGVRGPFVARSESLAVKPQFQSETVAKDSNAAKSVYVADVPFKRNGKQAVVAIAKLDGRLLVTNGFSVNVAPPGGGGPPGAGDKAISVHTQTLTDVGGDAAQLDTRRPSPRTCSRPTSPTCSASSPSSSPSRRRCCARAACAARWSTSSSRSGRARPRASPSSTRRSTRTTRSTRACARRWPPGVCASEPWTFVIDRSGKISTRFEGAFSVGELQRAVAKAA